LSQRGLLNGKGLGESFNAKIRRKKHNNAGPGHGKRKKSLGVYRALFKAKVPKKKK